MPSVERSARHTRLALVADRLASDAVDVGALNQQASRERPYFRNQ
jgi:hypothetical protein